MQYLTEIVFAVYTAFILMISGVLIVELKHRREYFLICVVVSLVSLAAYGAWKAVQ